MPWTLKMSETPRLHRQRQPIAASADIAERLAPADRVEEAVVLLGEVGLDANEEHRHPRHDRQVGEEDRHVVDDRRAQRPQHRLRRRRREPEEQLVDPDPHVVEEPGRRQAEVRAPAVEELERDAARRWGSARQPAPASRTGAGSGRRGIRRAARPARTAAAQRAADGRDEVPGEEHPITTRGIPCRPDSNTTAIQRPERSPASTTVSSA